RNFRCDCGNSKFGEFKCQLIPSKDAENVKNEYNHNFHGSYCTCDRLYPDPDGQDTDEMIQCVICEDWYHSGHLGCIVVEPEELQEMVCEGCMNKAPFLWTYATHFAVISKGEVCCQIKEEISGSSVHKPAKTVDCRLKELEAQAVQRPREGAVFWPYDWRTQLCTCTSCKRAYVSAQVQFLMDPSDTLVAYENRGLEEPFGQNPLLAWTDSMDRVQQLEVIYGEWNEEHGTRASVHCGLFRQCFEELQERVIKRRRTNAGNQ
uniref:UBR-type domain-containing protein n=1 Tax=Periophthalmus magnuspinnatus TaxID=409849 RepID=A0A3B4B6T2_9GOBI